MTVSLAERIKWTLIQNNGRRYETIAEAVLKEIQTTHRIVNPEVVTEKMLDACFSALPKHYDPPDPSRRQWHGYKARHRYTAMVKAVEDVK